MKTKKFLSMAALALVGAMMTGCSNDDNYQQPENKNNLVTLTTTVSLDGGATTRALTSTGEKTFAAGDQMAIYYYKNKGNDREKAVSAPLTAGDITNGGKSATFTFTLDNPYKDMSVVYVYPAAMANADFTPNYDALYNNQDGKLATLASNFDLCTRSGAWNGDNLPMLTLNNELAILAINLKDGSTDITSTITDLSLSDGTNTYNVSRSAAAGPIYVAIRPTSGASLSVIATAGTNYHGKYLTGKTYAFNNGYNVTWNMTPLTKKTWNSTNVFNDSHENDELSRWCPDPLTYEGITISGVFSNDGSSMFVPYAGGPGTTMLNVSAGESCTDSFTFTASGDKNFYKIEITGFPLNLNDANWSLQGSLLVEGSSFIWSKAPSNTVTITASPAYYSTNFDYVTSMVFLTD